MAIIHCECCNDVICNNCGIGHNDNNIFEVIHHDYDGTKRTEVENWCNECFDNLMDMMKHAEEEELSEYEDYNGDPKKI
jgi:hypothetical protein